MNTNPAVRKLRARVDYLEKRCKELEKENDKLRRFVEGKM